MQISQDAVVAFDYILKNDDGEVMDESGDEPLTYLHGHGQIVPGLEAALEGKAKGANIKVTVPPGQGYGERSSTDALRVAHEDLPDDIELEPGMQLETVGPDGNPLELWVLDVDEEGAILSVDHPLAGLTLHFEVTIREIRKATPEELLHGHAHGIDGHDHAEDEPPRDQN